MGINIYYACAIRNQDAAMQVVNDHICKKVEDRDCSVLAPYAMGMEGLADQEIYERDIRMISTVSAMIAECTTPSHGVGFEICYAQFVQPIPLLVLYHDSVKLSAMIRPRHGTMVCVYRKLVELDIFIERFLDQNPRLLRESLDENRH